MDQKDNGGVRGRRRGSAVEGGRPDDAPEAASLLIGEKSGRR